MEKENVISKKQRKHKTNVKEVSSPFKDNTNILVSNKSEGAASPQSGEARDSRGHNKSEIYLNNKNLNDAVSPNKTGTIGKSSEQKSEGNEGQKTVQKEFEESYDYGEEEEQFEDAQENKLSLTFLAENLNKVHLTTPGRKEAGRAHSHEFAIDTVYGDESLNFNSSSFYESFEIKSSEQSSESSFSVTTSIAETSDSGDKTTTSSKISPTLTPSKNLDYTLGEYECSESWTPNTTASSTINTRFSTDESSISIPNKESKMNISKEESVNKITISTEDCKKTIIASGINISSYGKLSNSATVTLEESCLNSLDDSTDFEISISMPTVSNNSELSKSVSTSETVTIKERNLDFEEPVQPFNQDSDIKQESSEPANVLEDGENTPPTPLSVSELSVNDLSVEKVIKEEILDQTEVKPFKPEIIGNKKSSVEASLELKETETMIPDQLVQHEIIHSDESQYSFPEASCIKLVGLSVDATGSIKESSVLNVVDKVTQAQERPLQSEISYVDENDHQELVDSSVQQSIIVPFVEKLRKEKELAKPIQEDPVIHVKLNPHTNFVSKSESSGCLVEKENSSCSVKMSNKEEKVLNVPEKPWQCDVTSITENIVSDVDSVTVHVLEESIKSHPIEGSEEKQVTQLPETPGIINSVENVVTDVDSIIVHVLEESVKSPSVEGSVEKQVTQLPETPGINSVEKVVTVVDSITVHVPEESAKSPSVEGSFLEENVKSPSVEGGSLKRQVTQLPETPCFNSVENVVTDVDSITVHVLEESVKSPSVECSVEKQVTQLPETPGINSVENVVTDVDSITVHVLEESVKSPLVEGSIEKQVTQLPETPGIDSVEKVVTDVDSITVHVPEESVKSPSVEGSFLEENVKSPSVEGGSLERQVTQLPKTPCINSVENVVTDEDSITVHVLEESVKSPSVECSVEKQVTQLPETPCINSVDNVVTDVDSITLHVLEESVKPPSVEGSVEKQVTQLLETPGNNSVENVVSEISFAESSASFECSRHSIPVVTVTDEEETAPLNTLNIEHNVTIKEQLSKAAFKDLANDTTASSATEVSDSGNETKISCDTEMGLLESNLHNSSATAEEAKLVVTQSEDVFSEVEATTSPVETVDDDNSIVIKTTSNEEENATQVEDRLEILNCDKTISSASESTNFSQKIVENGMNTLVLTQSKEKGNTIQIKEKAVLPENASLGIDMSDVTQTKEEENTIQIQEKAVLPENVSLGIVTSDVTQTKEEENTIQIQEKAVLPENVSLGIDTSDKTQTKEEDTIQIQEKAVLPENENLGIDTSDVTQTKEEENTIQIQEKAVLPENVSLGIVTSDVTQTKEEDTIQIQEKAVLPENENLGIDTSDVMQTKEEENTIQIQEKAVLPENVSLGIDTSDKTQTKEEDTIQIQEKAVLPENANLGIDTSDVTQTKAEEENTIQIQENAVLPENVSLGIDTSDKTQTKEEDTIQIQEKSVLPENVSLGIDTSDKTQTKEEDTIQIQEKAVLPENANLGIDTSDVTQTKAEEENTIQIQENAVLPENVSLGIDTSDKTQTKEEDTIQIQEKSVLPENVSLGIDTSDVVQTKEEENPIQTQEKSVLPENVSLGIDTSDVTQTKEEENTIQIQEKAVLPENLSLDNEVKIGPSTDTQESPNNIQAIPTENVGGSCVITEISEGNASDVVSSKEKLRMNKEEGVLNLTSETAEHFGGQKTNQKLEKDSVYPTPNLTYTSENFMVEKPNNSIKKQTNIQYQDEFHMVKNQAVELVSNKTPLPSDKIKEHPVIMSKCSRVPNTNTTSVSNTLGAPTNQQKCITSGFKISPTKEKELTNFNFANVSPNKFSNFKASPKRNLLKDFKASAQNANENPVCEFFIAGDKNSSALEFDERVAKEAANVSDHILNVSLELQESDSDSDNNKTVISLSQKQSPRLHNLPQPIQRQPQDSVPLLPFMQSMRSVLPAHLNQSEAGPITADELSTHDLEFQDGASLDLDFFNQVGSSDSTIQNSLTRHSLYVKFDPIVNAIVSNTVSDSIKMPPPSVPDQEKPSDEQPTSDQAAEPKSIEASVDSQKTPIRSPALEAVQKLISLTPPSSTQATTSPAKSERNTGTKTDRGPVGTPVTAAPKIAGISQEQLQKELKKLEIIMKDREKHFEIVLSKKEEELEAEAARRAELEAELKASSERELRLKKEVQERTKSKQQLSLVMEEYEKTISQLVAQKEEDKKEYEIQKDILMKERDTAMQHLNNMEIAFSDVHQKYERSKSVIEGMKANEEMLRRGVAEYDEAIKSSNNRYESLKNHAVKQLETANTELDLTRRAHQAELAKLNAMMKKTDLRVKSLEESLERKTKENQELAAICDELINKVGN